MSEQIRFRQEGAIGIIEFANPPMNFITGVMLKQFYHELLRVRDDRNVRVLVLTGGVKDSFLTHYDVSELIDYSRSLPKLPGWANNLIARIATWISRKAHCHAWLDSAIINLLAKRSEAERGIYFWSRCMMILDTMPKPVIAAINGVALGGGCEISLCCDFRFMAKNVNYRIGLPEVLVGIIPGGTGTPLRLPRIVGEARALEMLLTGAGYTPDESEKMGLINKAVEPDLLMPAVMKLAKTLALGAPVAQAMVKRDVRQGSRLSFDKGKIVDLASTQTAMSSKDAVEGMSRYVNDVLSKYSAIEMERFLDDFKKIQAGGVIQYRGE